MRAIVKLLLVVVIFLKTTLTRLPRPSMPPQTETGDMILPKVRHYPSGQKKVKKMI